MFEDAWPSFSNLLVLPPVFLFSFSGILFAVSPNLTNNSASSVTTNSVSIGATIHSYDGVDVPHVTLLFDDGRITVLFEMILPSFVIW